MRNATKWLLVAVLGLGLSTTAHAQNASITFQVDMSAAIDSCVFDPATHTVSLRANFTDYANNEIILTAGANNVYSTTVERPKGDTLRYKFYSTAAPLGWENDVNGEVTGSDPDNTGNRDYKVGTEDTQTLPVVAFNKSFSDQCSLGSGKYRFIFTVDMGVARLDKGQFNDDPNDGGDDIVVVAGGCKPDSFSGCLNGWSTTADTLVQDFFNPNLYSVAVEVDNFPFPSEGDVPNLGYKFVIGQTPGTGPAGWESVSDRIFDVTGNEAVGTDGYREVVLDTVFYNNVDDSNVFTEETAVIIEVDLRPAYYYVADQGMLPPDTQTGERTGTAINGVAMDGPAAGRATSNVNGISDWSERWGPGLAAIPERNFNDSGQNGDATAGDSIWTQTFAYPRGTPKTVVGKFGLNGYDNEAVANTNQHIPVGTAADNNGRVRMIFGAIRNEDGTYTDQKGPILPGGTARPVYDEYIAISTDSLTATVVRRGASAVAVEDLGIPADGFTLSAAQPNPFRGQARFTYSLPQAEHVTVRVFDVTGRVVATLVDAFQAASTYEVTFDGDGLAAGMYFYQVQSARQSQTGQMVLVR